MEYRTTSRRLPPEQTCSDTQQLTISLDMLILGLERPELASKIYGVF
jgi:hypothetical protein